MVMQCFFCENRKCDRVSHITSKDKRKFHRFPKREGDRRNAWIKFMKSIVGEEWSPDDSGSIIICSDHFLETDYLKFQPGKLLDSALPSQNIQPMSQKENRLKRKRSPRKPKIFSKPLSESTNENGVLDDKLISSPSAKKSGISSIILEHNYSKPLRHADDVPVGKTKRKLFSLCNEEVIVDAGDISPIEVELEDVVENEPSFMTMETSTPLPSSRLCNQSEDSIAYANPHLTSPAAGIPPPASPSQQFGKTALYTDLILEWERRADVIENGVKPLSEASFKNLCKLNGKISKMLSKRDEKDEEIKRLKQELAIVNKKHQLSTKEVQILKKKLNRSQELRKLTNKKLRAARARDKRKAVKINCLQDAINHLQESKQIDEDMAVLLNELPETARSLLIRAKRKATGLLNAQDKYDPEIRKFAMSLHSYSPAAYNYVRKTFLKCLPNKKTIQRWLKEIEAEPGFHGEALDAIRAKALKAKSEGKQILVNLSVDDMALMEKIEHDGGNGVIGYVNLGNPGEEEKQKTEKATQACVFMITALNGSWKIPCGYLFIRSLTGAQRAEKLKECILVLEKIGGVRVEGVTFDGHSSNIGMANYLGADLSSLENMKNYFENPADPTRKIHVMLDASHMLKLLRNLLAMDKEKLIDGDGLEVDWEYIEKLYTCQTEMGVKARNKLSKKHIQWDKNKMKVRLAAQTCSESVAKSIEERRSYYKDPKFKHSEGTIKYLRMVNKAFDLLNSSSLKGRNSKAAMKPSNKSTWNDTIKEAEDYFSKLRITRKAKKKPDGTMTNPRECDVIDTALKTATLGIILTLRSARDIFEKLVEKEGIMKWLLTYKLSQDHLEAFFGCIRRRSGCNNNPTCRIFKSSYKRLVVQNEIECSENANAIDMCDIKILHVASSSKMSEEQKFLSTLAVGSDLLIDCNNANFLSTEEMIHSPAFTDHDYDGYNTNVLVKSSIVEYIAGWVVHRIAPMIKCDVCEEALYGEECEINLYPLIASRSRGGLVVPSIDVVKICKLTDKLFLECDTNNLNYLLKQQIPLKIAMQARELGLFNSLLEHVDDLGPMNSHVNDLVKLVSYFFLKSRVCGRIRQENDSKVSNRNKLSRTIIFTNQ